MGEGWGGQVAQLPDGSTLRKPVAPQLTWSGTAISQGQKIVQAVQRGVELMLPLPETFVNKSVGEFAIATLPIALFYHDNLTQQRHYLATTVAAWGGDERTADAVIVFGYAIAQAIREQLTPAHLIAQILTYLHVSLPESAARSPNLIITLETLKGLIADGSGLQNTIAALELDAETTPIGVEIAIALYCFLQTPYSIALALDRAVQLGIHPDVVGALVGALAGAYTSEVGIPAAWRTGLQASSLGSKFSKRVPRLSAQLLLAWAGAYNPCMPQSKDFPVVTVPWVVRS